jgi:thioredoxin reductase
VELGDALLGVGLEDAEPRRVGRDHGRDADGDVGAQGLVVLEHLAVVLRVELVAAQDDHAVVRVAAHVEQRLAHGVGGALEPRLRARRLLGGEHGHEPGAEAVEVVGAGDVLVEGRRVVLRDDEDPVEAGVDAVGDRDVDEAVLAGERDRGLGAVAGEREEAGAGAAAEDDGQGSLHSEGRVVRGRGGEGAPAGRVAEHTAGRAAWPAGAAAAHPLPRRARMIAPAHAGAAPAGADDAPLGEPHGEPYDVAIVGGGPAGLSAAVWLGRYLHRVALIDSGDPRNWETRGINGYLGLPGIRPAELRKAGRDEARQWGVDLIDGFVARARVEGKERFVLEYDPVEETKAEANRPGPGTVRRPDDNAPRPCTRPLVARRVLIAIGLKDVWPRVPGLEQIYGDRAHVCPDCDGHSTQGRKTVVLGRGRKAVGMALNLANWADDITVCTNGEDPGFDDYLWGKLRENGIPVREGRIARVQLRDDTLRSLEFEDGPASAARRSSSPSASTRRTTWPRSSAATATRRGTSPSTTPTTRRCTTCSPPGTSCPGRSSASRRRRTARSRRWRSTSRSSPTRASSRREPVARASPCAARPGRSAPARSSRASRRGRRASPRQRVGAVDGQRGRRSARQAHRRPPRRGSPRRRPAGRASGPPRARVCGAAPRRFRGRA